MNPAHSTQEPRRKAKAGSKITAGEAMDSLADSLRRALRAIDQAKTALADGRRADVDRALSKCIRSLNGRQGEAWVGLQVHFVCTAVKEHFAASAHVGASAVGAEPEVPPDNPGSIELSTKEDKL